MEHLGMELDGIYVSGKFRVETAEGSILHILGAADDLKAFGDGSDSITMAHPYLRMLVESTEQGIGSVDGLQMSSAILTAVSLFHLTAEGMADVLGSIADAEHRHTAYKLAKVYLEGLWVVNAVRRTAEDHAYDRP